MPVVLAGKKMRQVRRFFADNEKVERLVSRAERGERVLGRDYLSGYPTVLRARIAGRESVVKRQRLQAFARRAERVILSEHAKALAQGSIKAPHYVLQPTRYVALTKRVAVMEHISDVGLGALKAFLKGGKGVQDMFPECSAFVAANPRVTLALVEDAYYELANNLYLLKSWGRIKTFDLRGRNHNVMVRGVEKETGALILSLIDQLYPDDQHAVERRLGMR